jgi:hypothetical protein
VECAGVPGSAAKMFGAAVSASRGQREAECWFYIDQHGAEQGPFSLAQMQTWYQAGYFSADLSAKSGRHGTFRLFADISEITGVPAAPSTSTSTSTLSLEMATKIVEGMQPAIATQMALGTCGYEKMATYGSAAYRAEQENRDQFQTAQAAMLLKAKMKAEEQLHAAPTHTDQLVAAAPKNSGPQAKLAPAKTQKKVTRMKSLLASCVAHMAMACYPAAAA